LSKHPSTIEAGIEAAKTFGVNSAGSPLAFGATKYFKFHNLDTTCNSRKKLVNFGIVVLFSTQLDG